GGNLHIEQGLIGANLLRPIRLYIDQPVTVGADGLHGRLRLRAEGALASRWVVPAIDADIQADGQGGEATLTIPAWQTHLAVLGQREKQALHGSLSLHTPLTEAMSRGLDVSL